jgi:acetyltransferase-like isoleucine patch superfamily enzyme
VTGDIPPGSIVVGNPGQIVRSRYTENAQGTES